MSEDNITEINRFVNFYAFIKIEQSTNFVCLYSDLSLELILKLESLRLDWQNIRRGGNAAQKKQMPF